MELHKAIKEIVDLKGDRIVADAQIINFLLDYNAFKAKPATKLILRDIINSGYAEEILSLDMNNAGWQIAFMKFERDFIDSCGYKEDLSKYVFEAIAYGIGLQLNSNEPSINSGVSVDSFFDLSEDVSGKPQPDSSDNTQQQNVTPSDLYTIALTFFNEGKYAQAKSFIDKSVALYQSSFIPSIQLKLKGDVNMKLGYFSDAIIDYNNCFARKAVEEALGIDELREQLKLHKIKGFENSMFSYYLCLYSIDKITKDQWLKMVKEEALNGLNDAILFCVKHGINPADNHINIYFTDKNNLKSGDYLYSDGTFAHERSKTKRVIAKVIITETTEYEKSQGWTHGYLVPTNDDGLFVNYTKSIWSSEKKDLPFPHSHYTIDDLNHFDKLKTIESEHYISIIDYNLFPVFKAAQFFSVSIPIAGVSKWFVPSIHWFKKNRWDIDNLLLTGSYWTSSQADASNAVFIDVSSFKGSKLVSYGCDDKEQKKFMFPVAAF